MSMRKVAVCFGLMAITSLVGCGGGVTPEVIPPLEKVSGKITLDGKPAEGVSVTFFPAANNKGNPGSGTTDASGQYKLVYRNGAEGIAAGDYVVMCSKLTQPDGSPIPPDKTAADVMAIDKVPERYRQMENPTMTVSVPKGGKTFDFDLKSK
jgi:hypothetical protein